MDFTNTKLADFLDEQKGANKLKWKEVKERNINGDVMHRHEAYHNNVVVFTIATDLKYGGWYAVRGRNNDEELGVSKSLNALKKKIEKLFSQEQKGKTANENTLNEDKRRLPRPSRKKPYVRNEGRHKHGERRKVSATWFKKLGWKDNFQVYDAEIDGWLPEKKFDKNKKVDQDPRDLMTYSQRLNAIKAKHGIENTEITELYNHNRIDRLMDKRNVRISDFSDKDLEKFESRSKYKTEEEWREAARKRVRQAIAARRRPTHWSLKKEDLDELIDGILDETSRQSKAERERDIEAKRREFRWNKEGNERKWRAQRALEKSKEKTRKTEDYDLDELIDDIDGIDETKRIPRSISGRKKWRSKVADDAKESGRDTETVNKEHRKSLSDSLRNSKKAKGTRYEDGKWHTNNNRNIGRAQGHVESYEPLSASDALLILQEKKTYYSRCKCRGKCDCEAKMKARREAKKNQIKESALVLYGKYYNTNITEPTIAEQFKKRIDYCIANERDFDFLQSNIYVELFESLINERQQDYDAFISDVEPQEDDLYKEAFTDEHVNSIVDEMFASETIDNLMDKRAEEEIAYINDNYKQKLKMMGLL